MTEFTETPHTSANLPNVIDSVHTHANSHLRVAST